MLHHRPHTRDVTRREQDLAVVPAEKLVTDIQNSGRHVDPHEREMPLQCSAQPAADGERLRPMQQVFLWNLRAEAGESAENLKTAAHHHKQRDCIHPVTEPHNKWMLVSRARDHDGLVVFPFSLNDFDNTTAHPGSSRRQIPPGLKPASRRAWSARLKPCPFKSAVNSMRESHPVKPRIALVFPVANFVKHVRYFQLGQILCLLVANLRRNLQP